MAEPWSSDLAALGEHTRHGLRPLDATRAVLARPQETKMRFFKAHPALATLIAIASLALAAPLAYAVVHEVWVTVDPDKPAAEIEQDVHSQLEAAGVPATVHADKTDEGKLRLAIQSHGQPGDDQPEVHINVAGGAPVGAHQREVRLQVQCTLDAAQMQTLETTTSGTDMVSAFENDYPSDADRAAAIRTVFAAHGFHDVDVTVDGGSISATVKAPPT